MIKSSIFIFYPSKDHFDFELQICIVGTKKMEA